MKAPFHLPVLAQDALLGLLVAAMQVQGTVSKPAEIGSAEASVRARPLAAVKGLVKTGTAAFGWTRSVGFGAAC
jgi:hypothetical protein